MIAYYFVFFLMIMISLFYKADTRIKWRWKLFWTFLPLFIYGAIRVDYGNDYSGYEDLFKYIHSHGGFKIDNDLHAEIGYQLLNWIMPTFRALLVFTSAMLCIALCLFCYNNIPQKYLWLAILLLFLNPEKNVFGTLVGMRSGLVVTSFLLGYVFIQKRKWIWFVPLTIGLSFIHTSAILYLPIAYIAGTNRQFKKREVWMWIGAAVILIFFSMSQLAEYISFLLNNEYLDRYQYYLEDSGHRGGLMVFASFIFIALYTMYFQFRRDAICPKVNSLIRMGLLYSVTMLMGSLAMRASYFYDMFLIASAVTIFSDKKTPEWLRYAVVFLLIATSYYTMRVWMNSEWWNHETYHSLLGDW